MRFLFEIGRVLLFFFYFVAWLPLTTFSRHQKAGEIFVCVRNEPDCPYFFLVIRDYSNWSVQMQIGSAVAALVTNSHDEMQLANYQWIALRSRQNRRKRDNRNKKKFICPRFVIVSSLLLFVVDRVHNILSRMAIAFIFVGLYLLVQGRSRLFLSLSCLCLLLRSFHLHLPPTDVAPHANDDGHPALFEYRAHTRGRFV